MITKTSSLALLLLATSTASAAITIPTVSVGDAGNPADGTGHGSVAYDYRIGTHEVTNSQYTAFLNAVASTDKYKLYDSSMGDMPRGGISRFGSSGGYSYSTRPDMANKPVNNVTFSDAARFANWLMNGQPSGGQNENTTEDGFYTFNSKDNITGQASHSGNQVNGTDWVAVASEDEWYKAAYYDGNSGYFLYPTQSDSTPDKAKANSTGDVKNPGENVANYGKRADWNGQTNGNVTTVGSAQAESYYGTFDQGGNVFEWTDTSEGDERVFRGGDFNGGDGRLKSSRRFKAAGTIDSNIRGFRVTSLTAIPEPSSYGAIFGIVGLATAVFFRRRRRRE